MEKIDSLYFDNLGNDFETFMDDYDVSQRCRLIFDHLLKDIELTGKAVLEVGCGTGRISEEIIKRKAHLSVLDIGGKLVQRVTEKFGCNGVTGDACALPFEPHSFDIVISSECIEHTPDPIKAITEMCRVCKPGGTVCITSPNKLWYPVLWLSVKLNIRKFRGIENWLFAHQASAVMRQATMNHLSLSGCHLWPFQLKFTRPILKWLDKRLGRHLFPLMINYGIRGTKGAL